ncbi:hypothetical protein GCM10028808_74810 [Spirosoma migulaei]
MKKNILILLLFPLLFLTAFDSPTKIVYKKIGGTTIYNIPNEKIYLFIAGLAVDADGSPRAYNKDNSKALDYLANAGKVGNWWALATDNQKK